MIMTSSRIKDILLRLAEARAEVTRVQEEYELAQQECEHDFIRYRDDDYCHTIHVFKCNKCDYETRNEPSKFYCNRVLRYFTNNDKK